MATDKRETETFTARGGWWVTAQMPLLVAAYLVPLWYGRSAPLERLDGIAGLGLLLAVAGVLQSAAGLVALGPALTPFPRPRAHARLRTGGVYALVRHPIYTGILFMALGWSLYRHSLPGVGLDLLLFAFFDRKAAREERWLVERFPDYAGYRRRVRKLIPWVY